MSEAENYAQRKPGTETLTVEALRASGLFDPKWYLSRYPDVAHSHLEPIRHYIELGMAMKRDPGPDFSASFFADVFGLQGAKGESAVLEFVKNGIDGLHADRVMLAAAGLARQGRRADAVRFARRFLSSMDDRPIRLLLANMAIINGDETLWLKNLNAYLAPYDISPIQLRNGPTILHRLHADPGRPVMQGPMVTVIMPAYQAAAYIEPAATSILGQSWQNLELIIVDDGSSDETWQVAQRLAAQDSRVRTFRNHQNLGPYVSKNRALQQARGDYITGHDADDWAHPQRIERHMAKVIASHGNVKAGTGMMLRVSQGGLFDDIIQADPVHSPDGIRRRAFISCLFERQAMEEKIGFYDPVRFAGDGEMIERARKILGSGFQDFDIFAMLCLNLQTSLTNHPEFGLRTVSGISDVRKEYNRRWREWHQNTPAESLKMIDPFGQRPFEAPAEILVRNLPDIGQEGTLEYTPDEEAIR
ncbi:MAG: glycosyltransferase family 2 protein [Paracoccus sp. (in: a-proteobacteria)]|nr:glycosyltransferase family 2 protein [Paracoccus sp. (in: a-proteobacteria)]